MTGLFMIVVFALLLSMLIGCYPPSYYNYWNVPYTQRYLDSLDRYDYYYPYSSYYSPYFYPYLYLPFFFSFSYSYDWYRSDYPHYRHYDRGAPHERPFNPGWRH